MADISCVFGRELLINQKKFNVTLYKYSVTIITINVMELKSQLYQPQCINMHFRNFNKTNTQ